MEPSAAWWSEALPGTLTCALRSRELLPDLKDFHMETKSSCLQKGRSRVKFQPFQWV